MPPTFVSGSGTPPKRPIAASAVGKPTNCVLAGSAVAPVHCTRPVWLGDRERVDVGKIALEEVRAQPDGEVARAAQRAAAPQRRVAARERETELRRQELKDVHRHLAGILRRASQLHTLSAGHLCASLRTAVTGTTKVPLPAACHFLIRPLRKFAPDRSRAPCVRAARHRCWPTRRWPRLRRLRLVGDHDHSDAHVERSEHLVARDLPRPLELPEEIRDLPSSRRRSRRRACRAAPDSNSPASRRR